MSKIKITIVADNHMKGQTASDRISQGYFDKPGWRLAIRDGSINSLITPINQSNSNNSDIFVMNGDMIHFPDSVADSADAFGTIVDLIKGRDVNPSFINNDPLAADFYYTYGHHDVDNGGDSSYYEVMFNAMDQICPDPSGENIRENEWWVNDPAEITDLPEGSFCAYTVDHSTGFRLVFLATAYTACDLGTEGKYYNDNGDVVSANQLDWVENVALQTDLPTIIFGHTPLVRRYNNTYYPYSYQGLDGLIPGAENREIAKNLFSSQLILPVVFSGHLHVNDEKIIENGVQYYNQIGNLWGKNETDFDRFSYTTVEITSPSYVLYDDSWIDSVNPSAIANPSEIPLITNPSIGKTFSHTSVTGFGYSKSYDSGILLNQWKLNEANGETIIIDSTGRNDGEANREIISVFAPNSSGINLNGNTWMEGDISPVLNYPIAMSIWFKVGSEHVDVSNIFGITSKDKNNYNHLAIRMSGAGKIRTSTIYNGSAATGPASSGTFEDNKWHNVLTVWISSDSRKVYMDGVQADNGVVIEKNFPVDLSRWYIGYNEVQSAESYLPFVGEVSDARIYTGILTDREIKNIWNEGIKNWSNTTGSVLLPMVGV
jgi:hypothetical protein